MLSDITKYFGVPLQRLDTTDWDAVEEQIKTILKSKAADPSFVPARAPIGATANVPSAATTDVSM